MKSTKSLPIIIIDNILQPLDLIVKRDQFSNAEILSIVTGHERIWCRWPIQHSNSTGTTATTATTEFCTNKQPLEETTQVAAETMRCFIFCKDEKHTYILVTFMFYLNEMDCFRVIKMLLQSQGWVWCAICIFKRCDVFSSLLVWWQTDIFWADKRLTNCPGLLVMELKIYCCKLAWRVWY